jgi:anti-sigma regulatory factor (Ser/Thr protein kinase)
MSDPAPAASRGAVHLRFTALPEHVRTARLVATAVARRVGMDETDLEGVRLAVGEACSRAVQRSEAAGTGELVQVDLVVEGPHEAAEGRARGGALSIEVRDGAGGDGADADDVGLLLMEGLADAVRVSPGPGGAGGVLRLTWSL